MSGPTLGAGFDLGPRRRGRRASLTPMIDVVFLLLVFFMLAARFGLEVELPAAPAIGAADWSGPPRLVEVTPEGQRLNGVALDWPALLERLAAMVDGPEDPVVLRALDGADLQRLAAAMAMLQQAGHGRLAVVE